MTLTETIDGAEAIIGRKLTAEEIRQVGSIVESGGTWFAVLSFFGKEASPQAITETVRELAGENWQECAERMRTVDGLVSEMKRLRAEANA